ncbi:AbiJ-NTD4 domain-containing protein [Sulfitobacter sp. PS-8MA]|uniref:AbiJ-NTD4 domain-containing protein n=1 Tax=Sulfitobacter sp. PS-8MA TaxID=3237707 RepID=UPI0034C6B4D9
MFSKRHGFSSAPPILFRHDAPEGLRFGVIQAAYDHLRYDLIRTCICRVLRASPDRGNWSEIPNIRDEVLRLIEDAEWYQVYDVIEGLVEFIEGTRGYDTAVQFAEQINGLFVDTGAGWQLKPGEGVVIRGDAEFEEAVERAQISLSQANYGVAESEIREALHDISRRPEPDLTGAIHHALGALESTARYLSGSEKPFNEVVSLVGVPKPLDSALSKLWGYSSNFGRHVSPTNVPSLNDATLVVHLSSAICRYLVAERQ